MAITRRIPGSRFDHIFFPGVAWLMLVTVFVGFAPTYYFAGLFRAPLPSPIIHVHAVVFSCWILLLITQTSLVAGGRVNLHRRLGIAGFLLASLVAAVGPLAATDQLLRRAGPPGRDPEFFYIIPLTEMFVFAVLTFCAFRARSTPPAHKRLILIATMALMPAAIIRWHFAVVHRKAPAAVHFSYIFLLILLAYDLWSAHKLHRATIWAGTFLIMLQEMAFPAGRTASWHAFAHWVESTARHSGLFS